MLKLKEKPIEWIKFTAVMGLVVNVVLWLLWWKEGLHVAVPMTTAVVALLALFVAILRPYWFRGFYRGGMTVSFQIGQIIGKVMLTLFFFIFVTPMGLLLRLLGKDLLLLKKTPDEKTYWHPVKKNLEFDRMF